MTRTNKNTNPKTTAKEQAPNTLDAKNYISELTLDKLKKEHSIDKVHVIVIEDQGTELVYAFKRATVKIYSMASAYKEDDIMFVKTMIDNTVIHGDLNRLDDIAVIGAITPHLTTINSALIAKRLEY